LLVGGGVRVSVGAGVAVGAGVGVAVGAGDAVAVEDGNATVAVGLWSEIDATAVDGAALTTATAIGAIDATGKVKPPRNSRKPTDAAAAAISVIAAAMTGADGPRSTGGREAAAFRPAATPWTNSGQLLWPVVKQTYSCWRADCG
jgi:hypothetical protein